MKLSAASSYAVRALAHLARQPAGAYVKARDIALGTGLRTTVLKKILAQLGRAGLLRSSKGAAGGHALARPARQITLLAIVDATGGPIRGGLTDATGDDRGTAFDRRLQAVCDDVAESLRRRLARVTLADLAKAK